MYREHVLLSPSPKSSKGEDGNLLTRRQAGRQAGEAGEAGGEAGLNRSEKEGGRGVTSALLKRGDFDCLTMWVTERRPQFAHLLSLTPTAI